MNSLEFAREFSSFGGMGGGMIERR